MFLIFVGILFISALLFQKPPRLDKPSVEAPTSETGRSIPVIFGTKRYFGSNFAWYGDVKLKAIKDGGGAFSSSQTIGYKTYAGVHLTVCHGPVDKVTGIIFREDKIAWTGEITESSSVAVSNKTLFGSRKREGGVDGTVDFEFGNTDQTENAYLAGQLTNVPAYRGVLSAIFRAGSGDELTYESLFGFTSSTKYSGFYFGNSEYLPKVGFDITRIHKSHFGETQWYDEKAETGVLVEIPSPEIDPQTAYWDIADFAYIGNVYSYSVTTPALGLYISPDGTKMYILSQNNRDFRQYAITDGDPSTATLTRTKSLGGNSNEGVKGMAWKPDGTKFFIIRYQQSPTARVVEEWTCSTAWNIGTASETQQYTLPSGLAFPYSISFSGDGTIFYVMDNTSSLATVHQFNCGAWSLSSVTNPSKSYSFASQVAGYSWPPHAVVNGDATKIFVMYGNYKIYQWSITGGDITTASYDSVSKTINTSGYPYAFTFQPELGRAYLWQNAGRVLEYSFSIESGTDPTYEFIGDGDMNPAHIIREAITSSEWGMSLPEADVDETSFTEAADTLYDEKFGLSYVWDEEKSCKDFISDVLRHIGAEMRINHNTGKLELKLIREDYVVDDLLVLDESIVEDIADLQVDHLPEKVNTVVIQYSNNTNLKNTLTLHDAAAVANTGYVISKTINYPMITNSELAGRVAERDLRIATNPLKPFKLKCTRSAAQLNIGDPFVLSNDELGITQLVARVVNIDLGNGESNKVEITAIQDIFTLPTIAAISAPDTDWTDPSTAPSPLDNAVLYEAPYVALVNTLTQSVADSNLSTDAGYGYFEVAAEQQSGISSCDLWVDSGSGYVSSGSIDFVPTCTLSATLSYLDTTLVFSNPNGFEQLYPDVYALIDNEIVVITGGDDSGLTIKRGALDTVPAAHSFGTVVYVLGTYADSDGLARTDGNAIDVKLLPVANTTLDIDATPILSLTFDSRASRPYPPAKVQFDGEYFPAEVDGSGVSPAGFTLTWVERNRLTQGSTLVGWTEATITPESGTTYEWEIIRNDTSAVLDSGTGITATSVQVEPAYTGDVTLTIYTLRDGLESTHFTHSFYFSETAIGALVDEALNDILDEAGLPIIEE